ncbi:MAG: UDP-glucose 4-epimerase GalE [Alphaproteobacteria bacterium]|nr:UDP-glucose 4-epimerase GalE [Alphaproteobacteria bacterium]
MFLVTGGAGYIGSHVVLKLMESGYDVVVFDSLENGHAETVQTLQSVNAKGKLVDFVRGDLKNPTDIKSVFDKYSFDAVLHFAAYIRVEESVQNPQKYYYNNVVGTLNLVSEMLEHNVKKLVFSSTAAVYGEPKYTPIDEQHELAPINPYGMSKFMVEKILDSYDTAYDFKSVRLRYFNVAGADSQIRIGEWHEPESHLIPNILASAKDTDKTFNLFGDDYATRDGTCVRDYVNVEDLADAHIAALTYLINGGKTDCFNIGTSSGHTVKEVFSACEQVLAHKINLQVKDHRAGDPAVLVANNQKAFKILGWSPERSLNDSIETAYKWIQKKK